MTPTKMVIMHDGDENPLMCKATDIHNFILPDDSMWIIAKVFFATTNNEAGQIYNDHEGFGKYEPMLPDTYIATGEVVK